MTRLVLLASCLIAIGWLNPEPAATDRTTCDPDRIVLDTYELHTWRSPDFSGTVCRAWSGDVDVLTVNVEAQEGGSDAGIVVRSAKRIDVDDFDLRTPNVRVSVSGTGSGRWWMGPKINVYEPGTSGLSGNYENYVIENASTDPAEFGARLLRNEGEYLGTTSQDGGTYRHYRKPHRDFTQFFAVRTSWRTSGSVDLRPILATWRRNGLPDWHVNHVRIYNVETSRSVDHAFTFDYRTHDEGAR